MNSLILYRIPYEKPTTSWRAVAIRKKGGRVRMELGKKEKKNGEKEEGAERNATVPCWPRSTGLL